MGYTKEQLETGEWVRKISTESYRGWKAFYHTSAWKRKRKSILRRDKYACQRCRQQGKYTRADTVHHKKHLRKVPELALTDSNLISLCTVCHEAMHPEKHKKRHNAVTEEKW
ncbi:MAG TPA: HNH endonuclease [Lachnospiraceae bacterium]|nr:HNH endonuclease [Lachnospiraceae bacterium]